MVGLRQPGFLTLNWIHTATQPMVFVELSIKKQNPWLSKQTCYMNLQDITTVTTCKKNVLEHASSA
jgi:hypothetical protein